MSNDTQRPLSTADRQALSSASDPVGAELQRYDAHLRDVHGLAPGTRRGYLRIAGRLLHQHFDGDHVDIATLQPSDIRRFLTHELIARHTPSHAHSVTGGLRRYLRYRSTQGDAVEPLTAVIASPAHWTLAPLPKALKREEVARLLDGCQAIRRWPKRGYAMARCALDLGLRAGEIAHLMIGDIDWQAGTVTLRATKSRRQDVLPLPVETGEALADYLMHERPGSAGAAVFVRALKPYDRPVTSTAVQKVITRALRRSGLPYSGAHVLRHTFAADLLERGSSLKEIADLLRHRSLRTTQIYAKLDTPHLTGVALPWPGSVS
jgi:integrase